ncbi:MAG: hypothetical protein ACREBR_02870 [bacterium]
MSSEIFLLNLVHELSGKATAYAIDRIFEQASQHKNYEATLLLDEVVEGEKRYKVDLTQEGKMKARHHSRERARQWSSLRKSKKRSKSKTKSEDTNASRGETIDEKSNHCDKDNFEPEETDSITSLTKCSCQFVTSIGLPCRHMFCVAHTMSHEINEITSEVRVFASICTF